MLTLFRAIQVFKYMDNNIWKIRWDQVYYTLRWQIIPKIEWQIEGVWDAVVGLLG